MNGNGGVNMVDESVMNSTDNAELSEAVIINSSRNADSRGKLILEQDRFLPIANISRLIKRAIPPGGKVSRDAKECIQECASEFISFITSEASDRCTDERRKTITAEDVMTSMKALGFDNYVQPLNMYLKKYREANRVDRSIPSLKGSMISEDPVTTVTIEPESRNEDSQLLLTVPEDEIPQQVQVINLESVPIGGEFSTPVIISADNGNEENSLTHLLNSGNVQNLDLVVDPNSGQHYLSLVLNNGNRHIIPAQIPSVAAVDNSHITSEVGPSVTNGSEGNSLDTRDQCVLGSQFALNMNESRLTGHDADLHRPTISQYDHAQYISQHNFAEPSQEARRVIEVQHESLPRSSTPQYTELDRVPTQSSTLQTTNSRKRRNSNSSYVEYTRFQ